MSATSRQDPAVRRGRGFTRAGGLIAAQTRTAAARRGYLKAKLEALWPEIAGADIARVSWPAKLSAGRGGGGGLLVLAVDGALAPQVQMTLPTLIERIAAALGPGVVGRIQLVHGLPAGARAAAPPPPSPAPASVDLAPLRAPLAAVADAELRAALETLARNVLSRDANKQRTDR